MRTAKKWKPCIRKKACEYAALNVNPYACPVCNRLMQSFCWCPVGHACCEQQHYWLANVGKKLVVKEEVTQKGNNCFYWICDKLKPRKKKRHDDECKHSDVHQGTEGQATGDATKEPGKAHRHCKGSKTRLCKTGSKGTRA